MKTYKIYISIEEYDDETDEYKEVSEVEFPVLFGDIETPEKIVDHMFDAGAAFTEIKRIVEKER